MTEDKRLEEIRAEVNVYPSHWINKKDGEVINTIVKRLTDFLLSVIDRLKENLDSRDKSKEYLILLIDCIQTDDGDHVWDKRFRNFTQLLKDIRKHVGVPLKKPDMSGYESTSLIDLPKEDRDFRVND